jgi:hypothetical protein
MTMMMKSTCMAQVSIPWNAHCAIKKEGGGGLKRVYIFFFFFFYSKKRPCSIREMLGFPHPEAQTRESDHGLNRLDEERPLQAANRRDSLDDLDPTYAKVNKHKEGTTVPDSVEPEYSSPSPSLEPDEKPPEVPPRPAVNLLSPQQEQKDGEEERNIDIPDSAYVSLLSLFVFLLFSFALVGF